MSHSLLNNLNPQQLEAVTLPTTSAMILAGAGSGKTKVLTTRIAWLVHTGQVSPMGILAVTFTNKAAKEMLHRLGMMMTMNTRGMWVGTFHGLCNRFLRAHHREASLPQTFQILDTADQTALLKRVYKTHNLDEERFPVKNMQWYIAGAKEEGLRPEAIQAFDDLTKRQIEIYALYEQTCQREGVVDFAELMLRTFETLQRNQPLREHYQRRFKYLLIDEFQDTNSLQYKWLRLLTGPDSVVFGVGDDDQSIYRFRGAQVGNMRAFERDFAPVKMVKLEQNYRSFGNILDAANALIDNNKGRLGKNLWTDSGAGEKIRGYIGYNDQDEALFVVDSLKQAIFAGETPHEMAVLYRSNAQSRVLEHALFSANIPYKVYGGLRFFERAEVKHALAYCRMVNNPEDDGAFLRVVNFPPRGIGARTVETLQQHALHSGQTLWATACGGQAVAGATQNKIAQFITVIETLRMAAKDLTLPEIMQQVIEGSGLLAHYQSDKEKDGEERVDNLKELVTAADGFMRESGGVLSTMDADGAVSTDALTDFLTHAALEAGDTQAAEGRSAVQLMTVHAAKGLEFNLVFITGLEEGLFPHDNSLNDEDGLQEERRLMYVAITRARKKLYLTHCQTRMMYGQTRYHIASRFLDEVPTELLQWLSPKPKDNAHIAYASSYGYSAGSPQSKSESGSYGSASSKSASASHPYRVGQTVQHAKFGSGVVVNLEGGGNDARVQVNFRDAGLKWLAVAYAKLETKN